jgi:MFS transporter, DHA1 family, multidrug resistance protein
MELFGATEQQYGWIFSLLAGGLILSSQLNNIVLRRYFSEKIMTYTLSIQTTLGLMLLAFTVFGWLNFYSAVVLIFLFLSCQGFSFPNASALSLAPFSKEAGSASALMGALQMGIGSLGAALVGILSNGTALPMTGVMAGLASLGLLIFVLGRYFIKKSEVW